MNSGVCIKGSNYSASNIDFYGRLVEILQLEYPALPIKRTILFKCEWFDPIPNLGTRIHHQYNLVDVHHKNLIGSTIHSFLRCKQNKCVIPLIQPQEEILVTGGLFVK